MVENVPTSSSPPTLERCYHGQRMLDVDNADWVFDGTPCCSGICYMEARAAFAISRNGVRHMCEPLPDPA